VARLQFKPVKVSKTMSETLHNAVAYCGLYCPDCVHFQNAHNAPADALRQALCGARIERYARVPSAFSASLKQYDAFLRVLDYLADRSCMAVCRTGGGCGGVPCAIMRCCLGNGYPGCWECPDLDACDKFAFLSPQCGDLPRENLRLIKRHGLEEWFERRKPFYIWENEEGSPS
jgi:hypothetical protein